MSATYPPGTVFESTGNHFYVGLYEEDLNQQTFNFMGKLVINNNDKNAKSYKPSNATAGFILYLLLREEGERISRTQVIDYIGKKFDNVDEDQIDYFIEVLEKKGAINVLTAGDTTPDPDPSGICKAPLRLKFETPSLPKANDSDVRDRMAYGRGQYFTTIRRW